MRNDNDDPGFTLTTLKEPVHPALQEKQAQVDYWGDRCCKAEARVAELEAREAILEGVLRSVQDCVVKGDGLPHALRLITEALVNRRAQG